VNQIRSWLFIGRYRETTNSALLRSYGIGAMLQLAEAVKQEGITSLYLPVEDGEPLPVPLLEQGMAFVREQKVEERTLLVACGAGISRSVTFAIAALHQEENLSLPDAFHLIRAHHPDAMPHYALWDSICQYYGESMPYENLWDNV
jgi:hypothetical protein